ncbi:type VI secretion system baseplate subunit TssG [Caballeronia sp. GAFFF1]|uniref:type VI secretion system baseplate subunit TssG n=1 Tax=Caballeronia sp. GAFFF1 TaxID=2921779 RepID=UPI002027BB26|nr:type VI secretion system baseplate subunit TssG [Caballeronia sp. GAFFF1]
MYRASFEATPIGKGISQVTIDRLQSSVWRYGLLPLLRRLGADSTVAPIGTARLPSTEKFRIGQKPSLSFAPREIAEAEVRSGRLHIRLFGLGMLGPNGPLPVHITEIARQREEQRHDPTLCNFLDIYHHRALSLLYRAWAQSQSTVSLDRPGDEPFSFYASALANIPERHRVARPLPEHARLSASPHLVRRALNPDGLRSALARYFSVPIKIVEYDLYWMPIGSKQRCVLGQERMSLCLGWGATLGEQVPDRRHRFRIVIGPLDIQTYHRFTPQGPDLPKLIDFVRAFVGKEHSWEAQVHIEARSAMTAKLGGSEQLGWSSWLGNCSENGPIIGMRFEPELYGRQFRRAAKDRFAAPESN